MQEEFEACRRFHPALAPSAILQEPAAQGAASTFPEQMDPASIEYYCGRVPLLLTAWADSATLDEFFSSVTMKMIPGVLREELALVRQGTMHDSIALLSAVLTEGKAVGLRRYEPDASFYRIFWMMRAAAVTAYATLCASGWVFR